MRSTARASSSASPTRGWELFSLAIRDSEVVESDVLKDLGDAERGELARLLEVVIARLDDIDA